MLNILVSVPEPGILFFCDVGIDGDDCLVRIWIHCCRLRVHPFVRVPRGQVENGQQNDQ